MSGTVGSKHLNFSILTSTIYTSGPSPKRSVIKQGRGLQVSDCLVLNLSQSTNDEFIPCLLPSLQWYIWDIKTKAPSRNLKFTKKRREIFLGPETHLSAENHGRPFPHYGWVKRHNRKLGVHFQDFYSPRSLGTGSV